MRASRDPAQGAQVITVRLCARTPHEVPVMYISKPAVQIVGGNQFTVVLLSGVPAVPSRRVVDEVCGWEGGLACGGCRGGP